MHTAHRTWFAWLQRTTEPRLEALSRAVSHCCCPHKGHLMEKDIQGRQKEVLFPSGGRCRPKAEIEVSIHSSSQRLLSRFLPQAQH